MKFKELEKLVEQQINEAAQCKDPKFAQPLGDACSWAWKATKKKPDGERIVEKAMKILETNKSTAKGYAEFLATEPKEKWEHVKSQGKAKREYKIFGAPYQRKVVSQALMEKIKDCNVEAYCWSNAEEYQECYKSSLPSSIMGYGRGVRVMYAMQEKVGRSWRDMDKKEFWDFLYKPSPGASSGHSTKFEGNLVVAINTSGVKDAKKIKTAQEKAGANLDPADQDVATKIIDEIFPGKSKPSDARKANTKYPQTEAYTEEGLDKTGTAKTDIIITFDGQKNVSVKKFGGAQYASAQGPEAVAIYKVAFEKKKGAKEKFHEQAKIILKKFGSRATADGTAAYEPMREAYNKLKGAKRADELSVDITKLFTGDCVEKKGRRKDHSKCEKIYARLAKLDPATNADMRTKILANWEKSYKGIGEEAHTNARAGVVAALGATMPLLEQIPLNFLESADAKKLILKEAVTGEGKFKDSDGIADSMLKWDDDNPEKSSWAELDEAWFSKHVNLTSYEYRKRGGSDAESRGMGFRLDDLIKESQGKKTQASNLLTEQLEKISNVSWVPLLLTEGVWTEGLLANIGKGVSASVDAFKQTIATMGAAGKEILSKVEAMAKKTWQYLTDWVKKLYEDGIEWVKTTVSEVQQKLLSIFTDFGKVFKTFFDVESASVVVGEGSDAEAPDMEIKNEHLTKGNPSYNMLVEMIENLMGEE
jgi:hypothetical protein